MREASLGVVLLALAVERKLDVSGLVGGGDREVYRSPEPPRAPLDGGIMSDGGVGERRSVLWGKNSARTWWRSSRQALSYTCPVHRRARAVAMRVSSRHSRTWTDTARVTRHTPANYRVNS